MPHHVLQKLLEPLERGLWDAGPVAERFEKKLAERLGVPPEWVVATDSATTALACATTFLVSGKEASVSPLTYPATYSALCNQRIRPRWVDTDEMGWPVESVEVGVELWGRPFPFSHGPVTILDSAHRVLDPLHKEHLQKGRAQAIVYSFNGQKEIPSIHGGALISPKARPAWRAWLQCGTTQEPLTRLLGSSHHILQKCARTVRMPSWAAFGGMKGGLPDPLAASLIAQLRRHGLLHRARQRVLTTYHELFGRTLMTLPGASGHLSVIRCSSPSERKLICLALTKHKVQWGVHYPIVKQAQEACPVATALSGEILSLPCHAYMKPADVRRIWRVVNSA